jgi:uncharacterized protein YgiM (DUF1202 family)
MNNKKTIWWIVGGVAAVGVGLLLLRRFTKKGQAKADEIRQQGAAAPIDVITPSPVPVIRTGNPITDLGSAVSNFLSNYQNYVVATQTSNLNVRSKPDASSKVIGSLKKGSTVRAKASGTKGWFAISDNDSDIKGYVSAQFLKAKK